MKITWTKGPSIPTGIEETFFHHLNQYYLIYLCGFNGGQKFAPAPNQKLRKYPRGLKNTGYYFDLRSLDSSSSNYPNTLQPLPNFTHNYPNYF